MVVGTFRILAHHLIEHLGILTHENAPSLIAHAFKDDLDRFSQVKPKLLNGDRALGDMTP